MTYLSRAPIDYARALRQHMAYCRALQKCGATVRRLDGDAALPDCAFVEDTAVVLDEVAVLCSMGAASRRGETAEVERELTRHRPLHRIEPPATLEGGDVVRLGRTLLVGRSLRTDDAGARALAAAIETFAYRVVPVPLRDCLHLKSACTALDDATLLLNPRWLDVEALAGYRLVEVDPSEPAAANVTRVNGRLCLSDAHPRTIGKIEAMGFNVEPVDLSEFAKAEACSTCLSLLLDVETF